MFNLNCLINLDGYLVYVLILRLGYWLLLLCFWMFNCFATFACVLKGSTVLCFVIFDALPLRLVGLDALCVTLCLSGLFALCCFMVCVMVLRYLLILFCFDIVNFDLIFVVACFIGCRLWNWCLLWCRVLDLRVVACCIVWLT